MSDRKISIGTKLDRDLNKTLEKRIKVGLHKSKASYLRKLIERDLKNQTGIDPQNFKGKMIYDEMVESAGDYSVKEELLMDKMKLIENILIRTGNKPYKDYDAKFLIEMAMGYGRSDEIKVNVNCKCPDENGIIWE